MTEQPAAGWLADPTGQFEHRYWTGTEWSEHVASGGQQSVSPPVLAAPTVIVPPTARPATPTNGFAIASLASGIAACLFGLIPILSILALIAASLAILFGILAMKHGHSTMAMVGLILGALGAFLGVIGLVIVANAAHKLQNLNNNP